MNKNEEESTNGKINKQNLIIPDIYLEEFLDSITEARIKSLYLKLKLYESKGYVTHDKYLLSMKETFDEAIKFSLKKKFDDARYYNENPIDMNINMETYINELYELYFLRFREIKCIIKNNKTVFYLTDIKLENFISSYNVICSMTIFFKSCFENKIKLLFNLTDVDEDGFLNENEIKHMIATCNFLFCEETNIINTNSSILSQSLMNIKVNNILKEILYDPGNLYIVLEEEKYINFNMLFNSIKLVKDYKYKIIPGYVNLKQCLNNIKKEKIIQINDKYKYDFIKVSSSLFCNRTMGTHRSLKYHKNFSAPYLSTILKPKKITKSNDINTTTQLELPNINKTFFYKRNSVVKVSKKVLYNDLYKNKSNEKSQNNLNNSLYSKTSEMNKQTSKNKLVIEKNKTFRELMRETTIIEMEDEKNKNSETNKNFNKNIYYNHDNREIKYIFEANFDKIRNIEVEPGLIKFINPNANEYNISSNSNNQTNTHNTNILKSKSTVDTFETKKKNNEKTVNFNFNKEKDIHSSIVQEEKFSEDQGNKSKTSINEGKKTKKIKIINFSENQNDKIKIKKYTPTVNIQENIYKTINAQNNGNKLANFYRSPNSRQTSLRNKVNFVNNKNAINIQKNIMNLNINEEKRYKTLDEVFHEIRIQENKFNSDSYSGYSASLVNGLKKIHEEKRDIKKLLGESDKKDLSLAFHKNYLSKLAKRKRQQIIRSKSVN